MALPPWFVFYFVERVLALVETDPLNGDVDMAGFLDFMTILGLDVKNEALAEMFYVTFFY